MKDREGKEGKASEGSRRRDRKAIMWGGRVGKCVEVVMGVVWW